LKRNLIALILVLIVIILPGILVYAKDVNQEHAKRELLIKFLAGVSDNEIAVTVQRLKGKILHRFRIVKGLVHIQLPENLNIIDALAIFKKNPLIEYVEPNYIQHAIATFPNDPQFNNLWGLHNYGQTGGTPDADIDAPEAWDITTGGSEVVIAVIDSGIDYQHEDLQGNIWVNPEEDLDNDSIPELSDLDGIDNDGNGYVDDLIGWDFANNDNNPFDDHGHGTHVSGTIAAKGNNGIGVTGVNWTAKIMALKFLDENGMGWTSDAILAIEYYADKGIRISNNSWGGGGYSHALHDAIQASQSLFVAAAGNDGRNTDFLPHYPSSYDLDNIVSVAATDHNDSLWWLSNYGTTSVDLSAPGVSILSTTPGNTYSYYNGTSMATPHVTGVAGLLLAQDSSLTINEMKWRILKGVDPKGLPVLTGGRLNANSTLGFGLTPPDVSVRVIPLGPTMVSRGDTLSYNVAITNNTSFAKTVRAKVYVQFPDGDIVTLNGPVILTIPAGGTIDKDFSKKVPLTAPLGSYTIFGQVETLTSFDEDPVDYEVVP
jgi:subtilisin family serine protease